MELLLPYKNATEAVATLDNGGRFYHVFTQANDEIISQAELGKVAGLFFEKQRMMLFLEMAISQLDTVGREAVFSRLDDNLHDAYQKFKPQHLLPSEAKAKGLIATNAIITGVPFLKESKTEFKGFVPISTGKSMIMIPIIEKYDVYEIKDEASAETFLIAHAKDDKKLPLEK